MKHVTLASALILAAAVAASAQSSDMQAMAQQFGVSAKQNAAALKMYSWKMRVEVSLKGEAKPAKIYQMRFDADGKLQKTSLTQAAPPSQPQRGLKGRVVAKKTAEMKDYVEDLAELCKGYLTPSPALLQAFFSRVMTAQAPGGWVQLYATDVIAKGDKLVYEIDPKTQAIHRVLFTATLDDDPVDGSVEFATVGGGGPNYAARTTVNAPGKNLTATIENFEYARQ
ncbi:MAG: hypothetical protein R6V57_19690 [Vicinamibacterales bacterium]